MKYNINLVVGWAHDKGLVEESNDALRAQFVKGVEEGGEIFEAILNRDRESLVDAIGDRLVVATLECLNAGLDPFDYIKQRRIESYEMFDSFEDAVKNHVALYVACQYGAAQGRLARTVAKQQPINEKMAELIHTLNELSTVLCVDLAECYRIAYTVIRDRTGSTVNGVFVKDE